MSSPLIGCLGCRHSVYQHQCIKDNRWLKDVSRKPIGCFGCRHLAYQLSCIKDKIWLQRCILAKDWSFRMWAFSFRTFRCKRYKMIAKTYQGHWLVVLNVDIQLISINFMYKETKYDCKDVSRPLISCLRCRHWAYQHCGIKDKRWLQRSHKATDWLFKM